MENTKQQCTRCKVNLPIHKFNTKRSGDLMKRCVDCNEKHRELSKKWADKHQCPHGKQKSLCKECGGGAICEHDKVRSRCPDCGGGSICEHNRVRSNCGQCGFGCEHNRQKSTCFECRGVGICEHDNIRSRCKQCGGGSLCIHQRIRCLCKECMGHSICEHGRLKWWCSHCEGSQICEHHKPRVRCSECSPLGYLSHNVSARIRGAIKKDNCSSAEYMGCEIDELKEHLEGQFKEGMTWENYGRVWHIDHIVPIKYENPTLEEVIERLHYTNLQPLWASENMSKGNRFVG